MYRFRKDGISVLAIVDRRRRKINGLYPVKIEVVYRVVITIPVYVGYEYDNYGSTAKKVEVKITFTPKN